MKQDLYFEFETEKEINLRDVFYTVEFYTTQPYYGVCPACGHRIYVPMDKKKREKIRLIVAGVCIAVFVVLFVIGNIIKG